MSPTHCLATGPWKYNNEELLSSPSPPSLDTGLGRQALLHIASNSAAKLLLCLAVHEVHCVNCGSWNLPTTISGTSELSLALAAIARDTDPEKGWEKGTCCNHLQKGPKEQSMKPTGWWNSISSLGKKSHKASPVGQQLFFSPPDWDLEAQRIGEGWGEHQKKAQILGKFIFI